MPQEELSIETATEAAYQAIADIYNEYILAGTATMEEEPYTTARVKAWIEGFNEREKILVVKKAGTIIGWGVIKRYSDREGYRTTCETSVYFTENETGKGYGTMLKKRMLEECKQLGYHHIVGKIWATNTASIEYNKKLGYKIVGTQKEIGWRDGKWIDVVIMQCIIQ